MALPREKRLFTLIEYLELEQQSVDRHEFWDGEILAMSGGTVRHGMVISNFNGLLWNRLQGKPCRPFESSTRVRIAAGQYVYPDAQVVCGKPIFDPADTHLTTIINPRMIIEVLSPSTESYDRGKKFEAYRQIDTLMEFVLVDPDRIQVQTFNRQQDSSWRLDTYAGPDAVVILRSLELHIPMSEIYQDVTFEDESSKMD
jgi:Uma2 family endonuclease